MPSTVFNHDVSGLVARLDRFANEISKSVSSSTSEYNEYDQTRLETYLGAVRAYMAWSTAQPQLDLPETHPRSIDVPDEPSDPLQENENVNDIRRMISLCRAEALNSQSARKPAGWVTFDVNRVLSIIEKIDHFLNDYIRPATPLDLPESSPQAGMTMPGRSGV